MSHYDTLGVPPDAAAAEVRRAYVALARRHHPDAGGDPDSMRRVNDAWRVLGDPTRRAAYDRSLVEPSTTRRAPTDEPPLRSEYDDLAADLANDVPIIPAMAVPRWLAMVPAATFVVALLGFGAAMIIDWRGLFATSFVLLVLAGASFVLMPFFVLIEARRRGR